MLGFLISSGEIYPWDGLKNFSMDFLIRGIWEENYGGL